VHPVRIIAFSGTRPAPRFAPSVTRSRGKECAAIDNRADDLTSQEPVGLHLLFAPGERPTLTALEAALRDHSALSVCCPLPAVDAIGTAGAELLAGSLTFDLAGLADGPAAKPPVWRYMLGCAHEDGLADHESILLRLGPHVAAGRSVLPIVRGWMECGQILGEALPHCRAFVWPPAMLAVGTDVFRASIRQWVDRGAFPTRSLIAFNPSLDGGFQSIGLAHFTGQELRLEPPLPSNPEEAEPVAAILAGHLAIAGRLESVEAVTAPDGSQISLEPSANGRFVRARRS
jgi:hypothetical protein